MEFISPARNADVYRRSWLDLCKRKRGLPRRYFYCDNKAAVDKKKKKHKKLCPSLAAGVWEELVAGSYTHALRLTHTESDEGEWQRRQTALQHE